MADCFCASPASNGDGAGGAIFSRNGSLKLVDVTISGNRSSTSGAGLEVFGDSTASFVIQNTIVANNTITANNGATAECVLAGSTVNRSGVGNLMINNGSGSFGACPGVMTTTDPQLDPNGLKDNGGPTPTLAIPLFSSAMGKADPGTSLPYDQRYADRPQSDSSPRNGYDIGGYGGYEVCRRFFGGRLVSAICSETSITPPPTTTLTMNASPTYEGTTDPEYWQQQRYRHRHAVKFYSERRDADHPRVIDPGYNCAIERSPHSHSIVLGGLVEIS